MTLLFHNETWKYPCGSTQFEQLAAIFEGGEPVTDILRLTNGTMAIFADNNRRTVVFLPPGSQLIMLEGDLDKDQQVKVRFQDKQLLIRTEDLLYAMGMTCETATN
jgi:hypothetical protein